MIIFMENIETQWSHYQKHSWKALSHISSQGHCRRVSLSQTSGTPREGFSPTQNLNLFFGEYICVEVRSTIHGDTQHFKKFFETLPKGISLNYIQFAASQPAAHYVDCQNIEILKKKGNLNILG